MTPEKPETESRASEPVREEREQDRERERKPLRLPPWRLSPRASRLQITELQQWIDLCA